MVTKTLLATKPENQVSRFTREVGGVEVTAPTTEGAEEGDSWCCGSGCRGGRPGGRGGCRVRGGGHGGVGARFSECFVLSFPLYFFRFLSRRSFSIPLL